MSCAISCCNSPLIDWCRTASSPLDYRAPQVHGSLAIIRCVRKDLWRQQRLYTSLKRKRRTVFPLACLWACIGRARESCRTLSDRPVATAVLTGYNNGPRSDVTGPGMPFRKYLLMTMRPICSDDPPASIAQAVIDAVCRATPQGFNLNLTLDSSLEEAGLDSLTRMHVVNCLEEAFHIRFTEDSLYDLDTCRDLVESLPPRRPPQRSVRRRWLGNAAAEGRRRGGEEHRAGML